MASLFISDRILIDGSFHHGGIVVNNDGKIDEVFKDPVNVNKWLNSNKNVLVHNYKSLVIMPGLIDTHVHMSEPGRVEWEGFETGTKAAAAGGFTTVIDMPLNSIPPTTTVENLLLKKKASVNKICTDIGFWGGIIPGNAAELPKLIENGVIGMKCFLHPSGDETFPYVTEDDVERSFQHVEHLDALIAFHAEKCDESIEIDPSDDVYEYKTYLKTRPSSLEINAIEMITRFAVKYRSVRTHIVHLSAADALPLIRKCREIVGNSLTVETCHHYLSIHADEVPRFRVDFKCCPPIRDEENKKKLWAALKTGDINMVVSDHSPSLPEIKLLNEGPDFGNFIKSWGGIPGVQFGLSVFWTHCKKYGLNINDMIRLMCEEPAKLCRIDDRKAKLAKGYDADFCIWDPSGKFTVTLDNIHFRNKANPYMGKKLNGVVHATVVRGQFAYKKSASEPFSFVGRCL